MKKIQSYTSHEQTGILLNANESSIQFDETICSEIQDCIGTIAWNRYPDTNCTELREAYASVIGKSPDQIVTGNGSDQILGILIGSFLGKNKILYTLDPDFSMYDYYASMYDAKVEKYPVHSFDLTEFIQLGKKAKADMIMISNPNNPTGMKLNNQQIKQILEQFKEIPVVMDEAYAEFSDENALELIETYPNLYVTRTLSKAYALASIRVGFLISAKENIDRINQKMVPYSVSSIDQKVAVTVLKHLDLFQKEIERIKNTRKEWIEKSKKYQTFRIFDSQANFVLLQTEWIYDLLKMFEENNIKIRKYAEKDYCRITIGNETENSIVWKILNDFEEEHYENG